MQGRAISTAPGATSGETSERGEVDRRHTGHIFWLSGDSVCGAVVAVRRRSSLSGRVLCLDRFCRAQLHCSPLQPFLT